MGKLDGMDPGLVRELLAEVGRAGQQMRSVESRITRLTGAAGLSVPATHRPAQVADAGDTLVKDVAARLVLLEKKEKQKEPATGPRSMRQTAPDPKNTSKNDKDDRRDKDHAPRSNPHTAEKPDKRHQPPADQHGKPDKPPRDTQVPDPPPKADKHDAPQGDKHDKPDRTDKYDPPRRDSPDARPRADGHDPAPRSDDAPTADPRGERPRYVSPIGEAPQGGGPGGPPDTPKADDPRDIDTTRERTRVIETDGVRIVEVTMKPPGPGHLDWLTRDLDRIPPMEQPVAVPSDAARPGDPHADGPVGYVEPGGPSGSTAPAASPPSEPGGQTADHRLAAPEGAARAGEHVRPGVHLPSDEASRYGRLSDTDPAAPPPPGEAGGDPSASSGS